MNETKHCSSYIIFHHRVLYLAGPAFFVTLTLATLEGAVAYAYFTSLGCDPLKSKKISNPNQVRQLIIYTQEENYYEGNGIQKTSQ